MNQRAARPAGQSTIVGKRFVRSEDGLPTAQELRELARHFSRRYQPSLWREPSLQFKARVLAKLATAAKAGRGLRFLSRAELEAVIAMIRQA